MPRPRPFTDEQLRDAVAAATRLVDVCRLLGIVPGGRTYEMLRRDIRKLGVETSHLAGLERRARSGGYVRADRRWTEAQLAAAVAESTTLANVCRRLGYEATGGIYRYLKAVIRDRDLDTSHFVGQGWAKGHRFGPSRRRPLDEVLVVASTYHSTSKLRQRLIDEGLKKACCEECGIDRWQGRPVPLQLDHINGDPMDNRIENLRILCPNCHAPTPTWCSRKSPAYSNRKRDAA